MISGVPGGLPLDVKVSTLAGEIISPKMPGISATGISISMVSRLPSRSISRPSSRPAVLGSARKPPASVTIPRMNDSRDSAASSLVNSSVTVRANDPASRAPPSPTISKAEMKSKEMGRSPSWGMAPRPESSASPSGISKANPNKPPLRPLNVAISGPDAASASPASISITSLTAPPDPITNMESFRMLRSNSSGLSSGE